MSLISTLTLSANFTKCIDPVLIHKKEKNRVSLIAIRHGEGIHNVNDIMTSSLSPGIFLTENGIKQVEESALKLKDEKIDLIYVSPLYRTLQTAQILARILAIPHEKIFVDPRLREQSFGDFEGCTWTEYETLYPPLEDLAEMAPNGESGAQVFLRVKEFLNEILDKHPGNKILIVTHGYCCISINLCLKGIFIEPKTAGYLSFE